MTTKVGVFLCRCSDNIASKVDIEKLTADLQKEDGVAFVASHELLCAGHGQEFFEQKLKENDVSRVVVAACSPRDHESTFQKCMVRAERNRFMLQMANIREQCTWVTADSDDAYAKSKALTLAAIRRVQLHEKLREKEIDCNTDVVVVGGGIAGIEAALGAAGDGRKVTIVESTPSLGGMIVKLEEVAPTMECAPCMVSPRISEIEEAENIVVLTNCDVDEVAGYLGNFELKLRQRPRMVDEDVCLGCDECIQVCPVEVTSTYDYGLSTRKAIDVLFPGCSPNCAVVDLNACLKTTGGECNACVEACPVEAMDFSQKQSTSTIRCGAMILATGADQFDAESMPQYGLGTIPDVYSYEQFARLTSNHGPTSGRILKKDGTVPAKIAFLHCVGRASLGYCSRHCCDAAFGLSATALASNEATQVVHLMQDVNCNGEMGSALVRRVVAANGMRSTRDTLQRVDDMSTVSVRQNDENLILKWVSSDTAMHLDADMVVLVTGTRPSAGTVAILQKLDLIRTNGGFVAPDHFMLRPAQTSLEGVFFAGSIGGGNGIADSIRGAKAAVGGVLSKLVPGKKLSLKSIVAHAESEVCSACGLCVQVCPYAAVKIDPNRKIAAVNEVLCQGCGTCVATCPSGAASARHFTAAQLDAEVKEVLNG
ncbi:MAG: CoB--CoM heterodisulfide reductase iron-sulfur subunit A family protein [Deltaproteobacteria bacterium]|nr:CoB--CoM heterodisulfide reductase iron-sulfur subunit A family protein [Deltaproteobacteria bacterium]